MLALEIYIDICLKDALIDYLFEKGFDDFFMWNAINTLLLRCF
ncbi:hypothetical protein HPHPP25_1384 [Helicobacter pylori Hp P-25]|nr:hypothetical protein HPHPP25_1384 [Helicobacter pylori Hp P-25]